MGANEKYFKTDTIYFDLKSITKEKTESKVEAILSNP